MINFILIILIKNFLINNPNLYDLNQVKLLIIFNQLKEYILKQNILQNNYYKQKQRTQNQIRLDQTKRWQITNTETQDIMDQYVPFNKCLQEIINV
ncbi:hypothetical protein pb186bvf_018663 [Paramecium bursaria]